MQRLTTERLLTISSGGHVFLIFFDDNSRLTLLDYLLDLADDPETPLTWQDAFAAIDIVGSCHRRAPALSRRF